MGFLNKMVVGNKKGVSNVIGYVLLIAVAVTVSIAVYGFLQSYIPGSVEECPDGVSIALRNYECNTSKNSLEIVLINNGRFNVDRFIIKAHNNTERMAIDPLVSNNSLMVERPQTGEHTFLSGELEPNEKTQKIYFDLTEGSLDYSNVDELKIEIAPIRRGEICRGAKFERIIVCST